VRERACTRQSSRRHPARAEAGSARSRARGNGGGAIERPQPGARLRAVISSNATPRSAARASGTFVTSPSAFIRRAPPAALARLGLSDRVALALVRDAIFDASRAG
jgi:hypothetical protein